MSAPSIIAAIDSKGVARLTLNRPQARNALDEAMIAELSQAFARWSQESSVRAIVIDGAGEAFCAGEDLAMMRRVAGYSSSDKKNDARRLAYLLKSIHDCEKPTIALVHGAAISAGCGLIAACDIAIAADDCVFSIADARWGVAPAVIAPYLLRAIGERNARRFFLTAERFDAETAKRIGLAHMLAMRARLEVTLSSVLTVLLECGPDAQRESKLLIRSLAGRAISDSMIEETAMAIAKVRASAEAKEGIDAFLEKRSPAWRKE
jgi:methylglutaconyl-CoA hydratase